MFGRTLIAAVALTAAVAASAPAAMVEKGRIVDGQYGFGYDCGFPVEVSGTATGNFHLREGKGDAETFFFAFDRLAFEEIHTNALTGEWFTISGHFVDHELTARRVEGDVFEVRAFKAGPVATIRDSDGTLVARDRGVLKRTILFDTGGDQQPGGEFVDVVEIEFGGSHESFGRLCEIAAGLIG
jgi:hypothetical protein